MEEQILKRIELLEKKLDLFLQHIPMMHYSVEQLTQIFGVSTNTIRKWCENYELGLEGTKLPHIRSSNQPNARVIVMTHDLVNFQLKNNKYEKP